VRAPVAVEAVGQGKHGVHGAVGMRGKVSKRRQWHAESEEKRYTLEKGKTTSQYGN
jgi:hypothetical protein